MIFRKLFNLLQDISIVIFYNCDCILIKPLASYAKLLIILEGQNVGS